MRRANQLIRAKLLEGTRGARFVGFTASGGNVSFPHPGAERIARRWAGAPSDRALTTPDALKGETFKNTDAVPDEALRRRVHKHVVRRMVKAGIAAHDGAGGLSRGPNWDSYERVHRHLFPGKDGGEKPAGQAFYKPHDVAQHGVLGVRGDWPGEYAIWHMDHIASHLNDTGRVPAHVLRQLPMTVNLFKRPQTR